MTDSGGFQVYSLVRQNPKSGSLSEKGMVYRAEDGSKYNLTPEKSIQLQVSYGGDIVFCFDDCTHVDDARSAGRFGAPDDQMGEALPRANLIT